jgi:hypothetical protein
MVSLVCPLSSLVVTRRITLNSPCSWVVHHRLRNAGTEPRAVGIWSVMMLNHSTAIAVPAKQPEIRKIFGSDGGRVEKHAHGVIGNCKDRQEFKVAVPNPNGRVLIQCPDSQVWICCETLATAANDVFAHGLPFEIFNFGDYSYCEAEWHAPVANIAPGEETSFEQKFWVWGREVPPENLTFTLEERELMACMF